jgi:hypothetical protein
MTDKRLNPDKYGRELDVEFYIYSGPEITTLRPFCKERNNKFFHYKEIMDWAHEEWEGKHPKTSEKTIFKYRGGYCMKGDKNEKCLHSLMPVSIAIVPKEVIQRNLDKDYIENRESALTLLKE